MRFISAVGVDVLFAIFMASLLGVALWSNGASIRLAQESALYPIGTMFFVLLVRSLWWLWRRPRAGNPFFPFRKIFLETFRDWIPFILIHFIYSNLRDFSRFFHTYDIAGTLMNWDMKLFGVELTLWSQRFFHPLLTDYMAIVYALYFMLPLFIMCVLSCREHRMELKEISLALSFTFLIGFLGYIFFPCSPPRYFLEGEYTAPARLHGVFIYNYFQSKWDGFSLIRAGAFPSLHVGISTIALIYAFRFRRRGTLDRWLYRVYVPLVVSLWVSTVYLRHHWFMDILAGWLLALFSAWVSGILTRSVQASVTVGEMPLWPEGFKNPADVTSAPEST